eukprot:scaffold42272_cov25-Prasinocladus_malaysianus.AAC.4
MLDKCLSLTSPRALLGSEKFRILTNCAKPVIPRAVLPRAPPKIATCAILMRTNRRNADNFALSPEGADIYVRLCKTCFKSLFLVISVFVGAVLESDADGLTFLGDDGRINLHIDIFNDCMSKFSISPNVHSLFLKLAYGSTEF